MRRRGMRGAILMDVLAAAFILSVGLLAVAGLFVQTGRAGVAMSHEEAAVALAQEGMERLRNRGGAAWIPEGLTVSGEVEFVQRGGVAFTRRTQLQPRPDLDPDLCEAVVTVEWMEITQDRKMVLLTYLAVNPDKESL